MRGSLLISSPRLVSASRIAGPGCTLCGLDQKCKNPKFVVQGEGKKRIMLLSDYPTRDEDALGKAFTSKTMTFLEGMLDQFDIDMRRDCWLAYAVSCAAGRVDNKRRVVDNCRSRLFANIAELRPAVILAIGLTALDGLIGDRWNESSLGAFERWEGWQIPDRMTNSWIIPIKNPLKLLQDERNEALYFDFNKTLEKAITAVDTPLPNYKEESECYELLLNNGDVLDYLNSLLQNPKTIAFDYETTGIRPYRDGMEVVCIGIADGPDHAVCFLAQESPKLWKEVLKNRHIKKIAHNLQFEDLWSRVYFKTPVAGWIHDTELTAHILDCRKDICRLKFQAYVHQGLIDYSSHLDSYIKTSAAEEKKYGANAFNSVLNAPLSSLMTYCAIDCLSTYRLYLKQKEMLECQ